MKYNVEEPMKLLDFLLLKTSKKKNDVKNLLKYKHVTVDQKVETHVAYELQKGQVVGVGEKSNLPFTIIYEDKEMIVIDKPCGLLTERTAHESQQTAYQQVKKYLDKKNENLFLVHRLDQYTSGVLMFVKTKKLYDELTHNWNKYVKTRGYVALVEGKMKTKKGTVSNYLTESKTQVVYSTSKDKGKKAITHYRVIRFNKKYSLLEVKLETGRKNQIRVHLSSLSHPIVGDDKYGAKSNPIKRLGLHANKLEIIHPFTHKEMMFTSKTPEVFEKVF